MRTRREEEEKEEGETLSEGCSGGKRKEEGKQGQE